MKEIHPKCFLINFRRIIFRLFGVPQMTKTLLSTTYIFLLDTPRSYHLLHVLSWITALAGMFFILAGHQHYSIDILIAWVLSSRLFMYYHT